MRSRRPKACFGIRFRSRGRRSSSRSSVEAALSWRPHTTSDGRASPHITGCDWLTGEPTEFELESAKERGGGIAMRLHGAMSL